MKKKNRRTVTKKSRKPQQMKKAGPANSRSEKIKSDMLRVLLRKRNETLGAACKDVGMSPTIFYYRLKKATFGEGRKGRAKKVSLSSQDAKKLVGLIKRQEKLQGALERFRGLIAG